MPNPSSSSEASVSSDSEEESVKAFPYLFFNTRSQSASSEQVLKDNRPPARRRYLSESAVPSQIKNEKISESDLAIFKGKLEEIDGFPKDLVGPLVEYAASLSFSQIEAHLKHQIAKKISNVLAPQSRWGSSPKAFQDFSSMQIDSYVRNVYPVFQSLKNDPVSEQVIHFSLKNG